MFAQPQRTVPPEVEEAAKKLREQLETRKDLPQFDIGFFRDQDGAGVGIRFYGQLPQDFELPKDLDGVRIKQR